MNWLTLAPMVKYSAFQFLVIAPPPLLVHLKTHCKCVQKSKILQLQLFIHNDVFEKNLELMLKILLGF